MFDKIFGSGDEEDPESMSVEERLKLLEEKFEQLDGKVESFEEQKDNMESAVEEELESVEEELNSAESFVEQLKSNFDNMKEKVDYLDSHLGDQLEKVERDEEYSFQKVEHELDDFEKEVSTAVKAVRDRQSRLEKMIDEKYKPEVEREKKLLENIMDSMRYIQDRLTAYGRIRKDNEMLKEKVEEIESEVKGKVDTSEFDRFKRMTREQIKRLKSRFDLLNDGI